jgi:IS4 transposase
MQPDAKAIMEFYRKRWQVELAFKRLKSLLQLGHLKKYDEDSAKAWLQGKLLVACLIETLILTAERFSPWGYPTPIGTNPTLSLA